MPASYTKLPYRARLAAARENYEILREYVRTLDEEYRNGGEYVMLSVRAALGMIGVRAEAHDDVIALIAEGGFDYCLDPTWENPGTYPDFKPGGYPPPSACVWGIDQLRSRLDCVSLPREEQ